ncbi:MAG TPA: (2Fe-2S)-binding protein [Thermoanaerobaculia bacterium]|nr:(2Fe-2S)-binding protein [Thermoanaerobaculia bacterium]
MARDGERKDLEGLPEPPGGGLSRRDFLRGGAVAGALGGAGLLAGEMLEAAKANPHAPRMEAGVEVWGPGPVPMRLRVNGKPVDLLLEPRTTLLDALRDELELTGAKRVCDRGTCGACTVLVDGDPVYACSVLAITVQYTPIQTVESLGRPGALDALQTAFVENDAQQCGFCTPGFVMAAKALLDHNPNPTLKDVHHGLSGNFCRCGTYAGMRQAVLAAAAAEAAEDEKDDKNKKKDAEPPKEPKGVGRG